MRKNKVEGSLKLGSLVTYKNRGRLTRSLTVIGLGDVWVVLRGGYWKMYLVERSRINSANQFVGTLTKRDSV